MVSYYKINKETLKLDETLKLSLKKKQEIKSIMNNCYF